MPQYRLVPSPAQEAVLRDHCGHARTRENLAVEQHSHWRPSRNNAPGYLEQCRQLTQALRDFAHAMTNYFGGTHGRPSWRKAGRDEGFRVVAVKAEQVRRLSRKTGEVWLPKAGWVRFRWSRAVPAGVPAARNIAAGHAVTARGGFRDTGPVNREPQLLLQSA